MQMTKSIQCNNTQGEFPVSVQYFLQLQLTPQLIQNGDQRDKLPPLAGLSRDDCTADCFPWHRRLLCLVQRRAEDEGADDEKIVLYRALTLKTSKTLQ